MPESIEWKLLLVDGHAYAYRAFHAIRALNSPAGRPTNALYGFVKILGKIQRQIQPTHWAVIWDGGLCAERVAAHPDYKSHRPAMPDALEEQLPQIERYLAAAGIPSYTTVDVEADDWIASIARCAEGAGFRVVIASGDKDFMQLVSPRIGLLNPNDKEERIWTAEDVRAKTGVTPEQVVDWLSLLGDSVDNIPGVPGVGAKTAAELLQQFGSLEGIVARSSEIRSERLRHNLGQSVETLMRNRALIHLKLEMQLPCPLDAMAVRPPDLEQLRPLYGEWGFHTLLAQLNATPLLL